MVNEPRATLVVDIGSSFTRVTLVDAVAGEARLIGQTEVPSTVEFPHADPRVGILEAAHRVGELTGRRLVQGNELLTPQTNERDGVNTVVIITSAAGVMSLVIAAVSKDISAKSAIHASRAIYTVPLQVLTLNENTETVGAGDATWIEQQVQQLLGLKPDAVLLAGGLEDGATSALTRLAHIISLTVVPPRGEHESFAQDMQPQPIIFAGNSTSRERVIEALSGKAKLYVVDNIRPSLDVERLEGARRELVHLYNEHVLSRLPAMQALRRLSATSVRTSVEAISLMVRFMAEQYNRNVLVVDVGSANTAAYLHSNGRYSPAVLGGVGVGYGIGGVLAQQEVRSIARWLPYPITQSELIHHLLNKQLRPHSHPVSQEALLLELAVGREALTMALDALWDERNGSPYDMVIASGSVLAHAPHPGYAALALLDALQPTGQESGTAVQLHLDSLGLFASCGALAFANPDAALTLFERDLLQNTPLATCFVTLGSGRVGDVAVEAEIQISGQQNVHTIPVHHGEIARLPVPVGAHATVKLRPASGVRIGNNPAGAEVPSDPGAISGSALGVIIDARGRPLRLPDTPIERQQALWSWLQALGAVHGDLPYPSAEPFPDLLLASHTPAPSTSPSAPSRTFVSTPATPEPQPTGGATIENELAKLRESVEAPEKKGWFGRRK